MSQVPEPASDPPLDIEIPAPVAELAASRRLGEVRACHGDASPVLYAMGALMLGAVSFGLLVVINWIGAGFLRPLAILGLAGIVLAVIGVLLAVKLTVAGRRTCSLFEHGFVYRRNRRLLAVTWPEVSAIARNYAGERSTRGATLDHYDVYLHDGTKIVLPVGKVGDTAKPFETEVERIISQTGITTERALIPAILDQLQETWPPDRFDTGTDSQPRPPDSR